MIDDILKGKASSQKSPTPETNAQHANAVPASAAGRALRDAGA